MQIEAMRKRDGAAFANLIDDHDELIAAQAGKRVVDQLEPIEVQDQNSEALPGALGKSNRL